MSSGDRATTLVVSNDFPPRIGGIETFVAQACALLDHRVVVLTSSSRGSEAYDATLPCPVVRLPTPVLLPTPAVARVAVRLLREHRAERVLFGAAAPLGLLAPALRRAGAHRIVAMSHGHERWWAAVPGTRRLLRRIGDEVDVLTTISDYVEERIAPVLSPAGRDRLVRLSPPIDPDAFTPDPSQPDPSQPDPTRPGPRGPQRPRCIAVGRFVARKGFGTLLQAWRQVLDAWPSDRPRPELVLVGDGPLRGALVRRCAALGLTDTVRFTGPLAHREVADQLRAAQVFAFPVRDRLGGLDPEGLGLAAIEAAACGLPVVVGRSGGAPETVLDGRTGHVVAGTDARELADRLRDLLLDPARAAGLGRAGRAYVIERFGVDRARRTLRTALDLP